MRFFYMLNHSLQALIRDGYKDMISGKMDEDYHNKVYSPQHGSFPGGTVITECAHIIPPWLNQSKSEHPRMHTLLTVYSFCNTCQA